MAGTTRGSDLLSCNERSSIRTLLTGGGPISCSSLIVSYLCGFFNIAISSAAFIATGKYLRGVAVNPDGRDGLAGREWVELDPAWSREKNGGNVKCVVVGGPAAAIRNFDSISLNINSECIIG